MRLKTKMDLHFSFLPLASTATSTGCFGDKASLKRNGEIQSPPPSLHPTLGVELTAGEGWWASRR